MRGIHFIATIRSTGCNYANQAAAAIIHRADLNGWTYARAAIFHRVNKKYPDHYAQDGRRRIQSIEIMPFGFDVRSVSDREAKSGGKSTTAQVPAKDVKRMNGSLERSRGARKRNIDFRKRGGFP